VLISAARTARKSWLEAMRSALPKCVRARVFSSRRTCSIARALVAALCSGERIIKFNYSGHGVYPSVSAAVFSSAAMDKSLTIPDDEAFVNDFSSLLDSGVVLTVQGALVLPEGLPGPPRYQPTYIPRLLLVLQTFRSPPVSWPGSPLSQIRIAAAATST